MATTATPVPDIVCHSASVTPSATHPATLPAPGPHAHAFQALLRNVFTESPNTGTYYSDVGTCTDPDAVVELQGECEDIVDVGVCSPASRATPHALSAVALVLGAAATILW